MKYYQSSGELHFENGTVLKGHSGRPEFKNNPDAQHEKNRGPIPRCKYNMNFRLAAYGNREGPVIFLSPYPANNMHNRDGFLIHGGADNASDGCIIINGAENRKKIVEQIKAHDDVLEVVR